MLLAQDWGQRGQERDEVLDREINYKLQRNWVLGGSQCQWEVRSQIQPLCPDTELILGGRVLDHIEKIKANLCCFAGQRGLQWADVLKTVCPNLEMIMSCFVLVVQRGLDQLVDILLIGWWWTNLESVIGLVVPMGLGSVCLWAAYS